MVRDAIAIAALMVSAGGTLAQDVALGEQRFVDRCAECHAVGDAPEKSGPNLNNLIGRPVASLEGFKYGPAMIEVGQAGVIWDVETLARFIEKPRSVVNGSNMAFTGYRDPNDVAAVIAYLATFSSPPPE